MTCPPAGCTDDVPKLSLVGIQVGQAIVAILAVQAISGEYSTGIIRTTFAAMPYRATVLAAKAAILTGFTLLAGTVAVLACVLAGRLILPGNGFTPAHGYPPLSLADAPTLRAAIGSVVYPRAHRPAKPRHRGCGTGLRSGHRGRARPVLPRPDHRPRAARPQLAAAPHADLNRQRPGSPSRPPPICPACPSPLGQASVSSPPGHGSPPHRRTTTSYRRRVTPPGPPIRRGGARVHRAGRPRLGRSGGRGSPVATAGVPRYPGLDDPHNGPDDDGDERDPQQRASESSTSRRCRIRTSSR